MYRLNFPYKLQEDDQLCFMHIPKTAGNSLGRDMAKRFPESRVFHDPSWAIQPIMDFPLYIRNSYQMVWGHALFTQFRAVQPTNQVYVTMLRDPIERTISTYYYILSRPEHPFYPKVKSMSLEDFLLWEEQDAVESHDLQTRYMSGVIDRTKDPDIDQACSVLRDKFMFVGLVERYEESLALLNFTFGWPASEVKYLNTTPVRAKQSDIAPNVLRLIRELNQNDIILYKFAEELFNEQLERMKTAQWLVDHQNAVYDSIERRFAHYSQWVRNL